MSKQNITNTFLTALAVTSIISFLVVILGAFFQISIAQLVTPAIMIIFGLAFLVEGQIKFWFKFRHGGYSPTEITHIITGSLGFLSIIVGIVSFFVQGNTIFTALQGVIASIAVVVIIVETWIVK